MIDDPKGWGGGQPEAVPGQRLAIVAESLYLANLLVAPGLAFGARTIDQHFFDFRVMAEDFCQRCVVMLG